MSALEYHANANDLVLRIKDLPLNVTEQQLQDAFTKFGKIQRIQISSSLHQTSSAAITFETAESAKLASAEMNNFNFNGSIIKSTVQSQLRATEFETTNKTVIVSFYPSGWTEKNIREFFGDLNPISVSFSKSTPPKAYVNFATAEEVKKAKNLNGSSYRGNHIRVSEPFNKNNVETRRHPNANQKQFNNRSRAQARHIEPLRPDEMKNADDAIEEIGTRIFEYIEKTENKKLAGKITGMILESHKKDHNVINELLKNDKIFEKINEAVTLLNKK